MKSDAAQADTIWMSSSVNLCAFVVKKSDHGGHKDSQRTYHKREQIGLFEMPKQSRNLQIAYRVTQSKDCGSVNENDQFDPVGSTEMAFTNTHKPNRRLR